MGPRRKFFALANHKDAEDFVKLVKDIKAFLEEHEKLEYDVADTEASHPHPNITDE